MIRLTIVPLIADLPWSKNRPGVAKETTTQAASQGKLVDYCSFGHRAPGRKVYAVWTLVVEKVAADGPSARSEAGVEDTAGRDLAPDRTPLVGADARLLQIEAADHDAPPITVQGTGHGLGAPRQHVLTVEGLPFRQGRPQLPASAEQARFV